jgi:hypothetical protein
MSRRTSAALLGLAALALAAAACDVRPLQSSELYGGGTAGVGGAGTGGTGGAGTAGSAGSGGSAGLALDGGAGTNAAPPDAADEAPVADAAPEAPALACAAPCSAAQFCDELTGQCAPRNGTGMISGQVFDDCSGDGISALVGIAGKRMCSFQGKSAFFFTQIPLGKLKLAAWKDGYELYGLTVDVIPGGLVKDIRLMRVGGCTAPQPADVACSCTTPTCQQ